MENNSNYKKNRQNYRKNDFEIFFFFSFNPISANNKGHTKTNNKTKDMGNITDITLRFKVKDKEITNDEYHQPQKF